MEGADGNEGGNVYNTRPSRHAEREDSGVPDSVGGDSDDDVDHPSRPESRVANRRADSRPGLAPRRVPPAIAVNGRRWNSDGDELPAFCQVRTSS